MTKMRLPPAVPLADGWLHRRSLPLVDVPVSKPVRTGATYANRRDRLGYRWSCFKTQARRRKIKVGLTREEFEALITHPTCTYCGVSGRVGLGRVQNHKGYDPGNVVPCCAACNYMKGKLTLRSFVAQSQAIAHHSGQQQAIATRHGLTRAWSF